MPPTARAESLQQLVDDANLVTTAPADWTYQQSTVMALQRTVLQMSNAVVALVIFWMGLNILLQPSLAAATWRRAKSCRGCSGRRAWRIRRRTGRRWPST